MIEVFSLATIRERLGTGTPRRQFLYERLHAVVSRLYETGKVRHIYLFGSFPTEAPMPNDVDLFVVMADDFWVTESIGAEHIADALTVFSRDRQFRTQPIVEVIP